MKKVPIEISARHIHLSQKDLETLFGKGYKLKKLKKLSQADDFAAKETVGVQIGKEKIENVRIVGLVRAKSQLEISITDSIYLGLRKVPLRISGNIKGTPRALLFSPKGKLKIKEGVIVAWRHIHCNPKEAKFLKLKNGMSVSVKVKGKRALIFHNVKIRVDKDFRLCMHLDTDEGNAAGIMKKGIGEILKF